MKSLKHFGALLLSLGLLSCANMEVADFRPHVRLPASGDCFGINVLSRKEVRLAKPQCDELIKRAIFLDSENYKLLRSSIQRNCQHFQCTQVIGAFDGLFLSLDQALQKLPNP